MQRSARARSGVRLLALVVLAACGDGRSSGADLDRPALAPPPAAHRRCGWIAASDVAGYRVFEERAAFFDSIHPKWFELGDDGAIRPLAGVDDARVVTAARRHGVALIPLVASIRDPGPLRAVLRDPRRRAAHVEALVALAVQRNYAGLDIDYEGLWGAVDRAAYQAFLAELAPPLRAAGKVVSADVPGRTELKAGSPWDYAFLAGHADRVHIMAYDYHGVGTAPGPVAPQGWVEAVIAHAAATGRPERFLLGLSNYGASTTWSVGSRGAAALCAGREPVRAEPSERDPHGRFSTGRMPSCRTERGVLYFDDLASFEAKVVAARRAGIGGITYWHLGDEPDGFFEMIEKHYP